jgi:hypothetical protein
MNADQWLDMLAASSFEDLYGRQGSFFQPDSSIDRQIPKQPQANRDITPDGGWVSGSVDDALDEGSIAGNVVKGAGKTFTSPDKYVGETANAIEAKYPGKVVDVNRIVKDSTGRIITDYDIELDGYVIQVKSGTAKGLTTQMQNTAASTGKTVIAYTPDLNSSSAVVKGVRNAGFNVFTNLEDLLNFLGQ